MNPQPREQANHLLEVLGADPARWPVPSRALLEQADPGLRTQQQSLDAWLATSEPPPVPARLRAEILLAAQWSLLDLETKSMVASEKSLIVRPVEPQGYAGLAADLARQVPAGACVETYGVRAVAGGLMAYHSRRDFRPVDSGCPWLLVQIRQKGSLPPVTSDWVPRAEIARPNHRDDHFMLYARR